MSEQSIQIFEFNEQPVRTVMEAGEHWWVAADVCRVLGLGNASQAVAGLDDDERMTLISNEGHSGSRGGAQSFNVINESGLYSLILRSRRPEAKVFKRWVTHEVLPAIRKTGAYSLAQTEMMPVYRFCIDAFGRVGAAQVVKQMLKEGLECAAALRVKPRMVEDGGWGSQPYLPRNIWEWAKDNLGLRTPIRQLPPMEAERRHRERLLAALPEDRLLEFSEVVAICREAKLYLEVVGKEGELTQAQKGQMGKFLTRQAGMIAEVEGRNLALEARGRNRHRLYCVKEVRG